MKDSELEHEFALDTEKIELFLNEVIRKNLLPNFKYSGASAMGSAKLVKFNYASIRPSDNFTSYRNSKYYLNGPYKFIHYTSIPKLISIIRDKKIRLYDLNGMDDKDEFNFAHKILNKDWQLDSIEAKSRIFSLSMCKYELEEKEQSLNMWRQFGGDGNGVGIVLNFSKKYRGNWNRFVLSEVHYGESSLKKLKQTYDSYLDYCKKHKFTISNFNELLYKLLCFHKQQIYKDEKEVRLIFNSGFNSYSSVNAKADLSHKFQKTSYCELEIESERWKRLTGEHENYQKLAQKIYPYVTIDKIILGYRLSENERMSVVEAFSTYRSNYKTIPKFEYSKLRKYFKND